MQMNYWIVFLVIFRGGIKMSSKAYVENVVRQNLSFYLRDNFAEVDVDASIINAGYEIDSIVIIEILVALESEFDIEFADEELTSDTLYSVRTLTEAVLRHIMAE